MAFDWKKALKDGQEKASKAFDAAAAKTEEYAGKAEAAVGGLVAKVEEKLKKAPKDNTPKNG